MADGVQPIPRSGENVVMVVDDSREIRDVLAELLIDEGYAVQEAENGLEALKLLRAGCRPMVILLDLMMPVMDGWRFCEELTKDASLSAIPVVAITAGRSDELIPGAIARLLKPFDVDQVLQEVRAHGRAAPLPVSGVA